MRKIDTIRKYKFDLDMLYCGETDITGMTGNLAWKNSIYELATNMTFDIAKSDGAYIKELLYVPKAGEIIRMVTNTEIFRGVITKVDDGNPSNHKGGCFV